MSKASYFPILSLVSWLTISLYIYLQGKSIGKINYFLLFQLLIGVLLVFLPDGIQKIFHIAFPTLLLNFYQLFLILAIFLGTGLNFVNKIPHWDKGLHVLCGMFFSLMGYCLLTLLVDTTTTHSIWVYLVFGFCFSLAIGVLWEFWEFFCDCFLGMNLQQFDGPKRTPKLGQAALMDTMIDLLADFLGAIILVVITLFKHFHQENYLLRFMITRK